VNDNQVDRKAVDRLCLEVTKAVASSLLVYVGKHTGPGMPATRVALAVVDSTLAAAAIVLTSWNGELHQDDAVELKDELNAALGRWLEKRAEGRSGG